MCKLRTVLLCVITLLCFIASNSSIASNHIKRDQNVTSTKSGQQGFPRLGFWSIFRPSQVDYKENSSGHNDIVDHNYILGVDYYLFEAFLLGLAYINNPINNHNSFLAGTVNTNIYGMMPYLKLHFGQYVYLDTFYAYNWLCTDIMTNQPIANNTGHFDGFNWIVGFGLNSALRFQRFSSRSRIGIFHSQTKNYAYTDSSNRHFSNRFSNLTSLTATQRISYLWNLWFQTFLQGHIIYDVRRVNTNFTQQFLIGNTIPIFLDADSNDPNRFGFAITPGVEFVVNDYSSLSLSYEYFRRGNNLSSHSALINIHFRV